MDCRIILLSLCFLCLLRYGQCLDCHQCASKDGPGCTDYYDPIEGEENIDGCDDKDTHCLKVKIIAKLADSGSTFGSDRRSVVTTRGCVREDGARDYCKALSSSQGVMFICICSGDNCNSGRSLGTSFWFMFMALITALGTIKLM